MLRGTNVISMSTFEEEKQAQRQMLEANYAKTRTDSENLTLPGSKNEKSPNSNNSINSKRGLFSGFTGLFGRKKDTRTTGFKNSDEETKESDHKEQAKKSRVTTYNVKKEDNSILQQS